MGGLTAVLLIRCGLEAIMSVDVEALGPLYENAARAAAAAGGRVSVRLRRTVNLRLALEFSVVDERQRPITKGSACVNSIVR